MKNLLFIVLIPFVFACKTNQTIIDPISKKEVKIYENELFKFYYPVEWKEFYLFNQKQSLVSIAPKVEIKNVYVLPDNISVDIKNLNSYKKNLVMKYFSAVNFTICKDSLPDESLENFIAKEKEKIEKNLFHANSKYSFEKQKNNYFILNYSAENEKDKNRNIIIIKHYYYFQNNVYSLAYLTSNQKQAKYLKDAQFIFSSFIFKNPETPLIPRPTP